MSSGEDIEDKTDGGGVPVAEYVLGVLPAVEHEAVGRQIAADPVLRAERRYWHDHFAGLDSGFAEAAAPANGWSRLERRLFAGAGAASGSWWDSLLFWRGLAGAALAVAVIAVGFNLSRPALDAEAIATQLVAALEAQEGSGVEFVAFYDATSGSVKLVGLSGNAVPDRDYELWYIAGDDPAVSMGVVPVDARLSIPVPPEAREKFAQGTVLAVTLEQKGGSPTGVAQGPIVSAGAASPI
jgi:anti-sigma-K factor RskA